MQFEATIEEIQKVCALAYNHSAPMGMGFLQHQPGDIDPGEFDVVIGRGINLDYVKGRMVKLYLHQVDANMWSVPDRHPSPDYQSWCRQFPTYGDLLREAGIAV